MILELGRNLIEICYVSTVNLFSCTTKYFAPDNMLDQTSLFMFAYFQGSAFMLKRMEKLTPRTNIMNNGWIGISCNMFIIISMLEIFIQIICWNLICFYHPRPKLNKNLSLRIDSRRGTKI